jgi:hypothetical protein
VCVVLVQAAPVEQPKARRAADQAEQVNHSLASAKTVITREARKWAGGSGQRRELLGCVFGGWGGRRREGRQLRL